MSDDIRDLRERQIEGESRLVTLERTLGEIHADLQRLAVLLRGNGGQGLVARVESNRERINALQSQWRWILGILVALLAASIKTLFGI